MVETTVCVIGAGPAGITLARRMERAGVTTAVLESGAFELDADTQELAGGENIGLPYFPLISTRLRYFGGTTNHWSGTCRPFDAFDLAPHAWIPASGWPIGLGELDRYYPAAAEACQLTSDQWDAGAWVDRSPFDPVPVPDDGPFETRVAQLVVGSDRRWRGVFRDELDAAESVQVYLNATAVELTSPSDGSRVDRVHVRTLEGGEFSVAARLVVVATGGIDNARLLLASNASRPSGLGNDHDLVGRYFLEHPRITAGIIVPIDPRLDLRFHEPHRIGDASVLGYLGVKPHEREREEIVDVQFRLRPIYRPFYEEAGRSDDVEAVRRLIERGERQSNAPIEDLEAIVDDLTSWRRFFIWGGSAPIPAPETVATLLGADEAVREALTPAFFGDVATFYYGETVGGIPLNGVEVTARVEPVPNPDSRITLTRERDALGVPRVALDWRLSELDRRSVDRAMELLATDLGRSGLGRVRLLAQPGDTAWPDDLAGGWHHMGTTRMSERPTDGVVDPTCRVHGVANLYVAGSSVFPTAGSGTPTMTIVALAERLADELIAVVAT